MSQDLFPADLTNPQSLNRHAYVENDSVNYIDPVGLDKKAQ
ncbi:MAG: hypothetical protein ACYC5F_10210 [Thermoleophilia bacterium]